jgi:hypothetical protein
MLTHFFALAAFAATRANSFTSNRTGRLAIYSDSSATKRPRVNLKNSSSLFQSKPTSVYIALGLINMNIPVICLGVVEHNDRVGGLRFCRETGVHVKGDALTKCRRLWLRYDIMARWSNG